MVVRSRVKEKREVINRGEGELGKEKLGVERVRRPGRVGKRPGSIKVKREGRKPQR